MGAITEQVSVEATSARPADEQGGCQRESGHAGDGEPAALRTTATTRSLINLVPGATPARFQNAVTDTPGRALTTNVNGQERGANNTRVDGSADILVTMPHHAVYVPPVESIEEVNISTNNFDAEQGMTGGAAVTVITKSGTNNFRGTRVHDATTATAMRAFTWDENRAGADRQARRKAGASDGGSLGGPIKKNKLFFFANWEGTFERVNRFLEPLLRPDCRLPHAAISAACWGRRF